MDPERAKQIAGSPIMANVTLQGTPVYIEHVNEAQMTADVHFLDKPLSQKKQVPLINLIEHSMKNGL
jgi:small acid-soluble spore protein H (minor)